MSARIALQVAIEALDASLTSPPPGLSADELETIRGQRARTFLSCAQALYSDVTGQAIRTPRGAM